MHIQNPPSTRQFEGDHPAGISPTKNENRNSPSNFLGNTTYSSELSTPNIQLSPSTHQNKPKCRCGQTFSGKSELTRHKGSVHFMDGGPRHIWYCPFLGCSRNRESREIQPPPFMQRSNLELHLKTQHGEAYLMDNAAVKKLCDNSRIDRGSSELAKAIYEGLYQLYRV